MGPHVFVSLLLFGGQFLRRHFRPFDRIFDEPLQAGQILAVEQGHKSIGGNIVSRAYRDQDHAENNPRRAGARQNPPHGRTSIDKSWGKG